MDYIVEYSDKLFWSTINRQSAEQKKEGMPNALIEAMSIGLPSIATDCPCGGPASLIENGKNGILVPVGDADAMAEAMDTLLNDDEMRINMGLEATKIREMVNTDFVYGQWKNYMETLM